MGKYEKNWPTCTFKSTTDGNWELSGSGWVSYGNWTGSWLRMDDLAEKIPIGAEIKDVSYSINGDPQKQIHVDGQYAGLLSKDLLMRYLQEGKRNIAIYLSWRLVAYEGTINKPTGVKTKTIYVSSPSISITFEGGNGAVTVIRYGIGGEWVDCDAYIGQGGKYVPFEMRYPDNGGWQKIEQRILEE